MTKEEAIEIAKKEFLKPTITVMEVLLEVHTYVLEDNEIKISRVDLDYSEKNGIVYAPVKDEYFSFALLINKISKKVLWVYTESYNVVQFSASSNKLSGDELSKLTTIKCSNITNKGDVAGWGPETYNFSSISISIDPSIPENIYIQLLQLTAILKTDIEGIKQLVEKAEGEISVLIMPHIGDKSLESICLGKEVISIMNAIGASINIHTSLQGKEMDSPTIRDIKEKKSN